MTHTPGPWETQIKREHKYGQNHIVANGNLVASVDSAISPKEREEWHANAHLIAAAPDLLEALKKWEEFMENNYSPKDLSFWDETKAAIAKAAE